MMSLPFENEIFVDPIVIPEKFAPNIVAVHIPANLNIQEIVQVHPLYNCPSFKIEKLYYFLSYLYNNFIALDSETFVHPKLKELNRPFFIPIHSSILKNIFGNEYLDYIHFLRDEGVIIMFPCALENERSNSFRFTDKYLYCKTSQRLPLYDFILSTKIASNHIKNSRRKLAHHLSLEKRIMSKGLKLDLNYAAYLNEAHQAQSYRDIEDLRGVAYAESLQKIENRHLFISRLIENLASNRYYYTINGDHYRHYSTVTSSPKILRAAYNWHNEELVEVDLKNSQFLMSTMLLKKSTWTDASKDKVLRKIWEGISCKDNHVDKKEYRTIMRLIDKIALQYKSELPYIQLTLNGELYEDLINDLIDAGHIEEGLPPDQQRGIAKDLMIRSLFAKTNTSYHKRYNSVWSIMKRRHPEAVEIFEFIKSYEHLDMARLLQRIESIFVIDTVCKRLNEDYPKIPIFTLHDCIVTTVGNEALVDQIIKEEMEKSFGFKGKTKVQPWETIVPPIFDFSLVKAA
ncbi:MAG: hypothetical protein EOO43_13910 [Flavobacterium sp.]|nr:MAG: hypothetical protein EOO43_13910 [Flavobacterium sp.]